MDPALLQRITEITEEIYLQQSGKEGTGIRQQFLIERRHMSELSMGNADSAVAISVHPRFRAFPEHGHDFIEMMYVCSGSITHRIGNQSVTLEYGDLLLFGRETRHAIDITGAQDIGINVIISTDFFASLLPRLRESATFPDKLFDRIMEAHENAYAVFRTNGILPIGNLMESLAYSLVEKQLSDSFVLQQSLSLLLAYLADTPQIRRTDSSAADYVEQTRRRLFDYLRTSYRHATLREAATVLGFSPSYLCRWIRTHMDTTFKALLASQRFSVAEQLLLTTDYSVEMIIEHVGYENRSYFHKQFRQRYGTTPHRYRAQFRQKA